MRPRPFRQCPTNVNISRQPRPMSARPLAKSAHAESPKQSSANEESSSQNPASSKTPAPLPRWSDASRWPTYAALAIAVIAVALAALAYFHPAHKGASLAQQGGEDRK